MYYYLKNKDDKIVCSFLLGTFRQKRWNITIMILPILAFFHYMTYWKQNRFLAYRYLHNKVVYKSGLQSDITITIKCRQFQMTLQIKHLLYSVFSSIGNSFNIAKSRKKLPISHLFPVNPPLQLQVKSLMPSTHCPLPEHVSSLHSSMSVIKKK